MWITTHNNRLIKVAKHEQIFGLFLDAFMFYYMKACGANEERILTISFPKLNTSRMQQRLNKSTKT